MFHVTRISILAFLAVAVTAVSATAQEATVEEKSESTKTAAPSKKPEPQLIKLAEGNLVLPVPGDWKRVKPKSRIVQHEFAISPAKEDQAPGRMTIMAAGGGIEANINRWVGQFKSADGGRLADEAKRVEKKKVGDLTVHTVDLTGTYLESMRGPFGPKTDRPNYRMLAAIVPVDGNGTWFIKAYGPQETMKAAEAGFAKMVEGATSAP